MRSLTSRRPSMARLRAGGAADKALVGGLGLGQFAGIHQALGALERYRNLALGKIACSWWGFRNRRLESGVRCSVRAWAAWAISAAASDRAAFPGRGTGRGRGSGCRAVADSGAERITGTRDGVAAVGAGPGLPSGRPGRLSRRAGCIGEGRLRGFPRPQQG